MRADLAVRACALAVRSVGRCVPHAPAVSTSFGSVLISVASSIVLMVGGDGIEPPANSV